MKTILIPVDFSDVSAKVVEAAALLAEVRSKEAVQLLAQLDASGVRAG